MGVTKGDTSSLDNGSFRVLLKWIEYGVHGDLIIIYPKPYSVYLRGTIRSRVRGSGL